MGFPTGTREEDAPPPNNAAPKTPVEHAPALVAPGATHVNVLRLPSCWIEIELLDQEEHGVAGEPYWVRLPNGVIREGQLDENGVARLEKIPCGDCLVRFPGLDGQEWVVPASSDPEPNAWLEIALLDETGTPLAREPYRVQTPDGQQREGTLDASGYARIEGVLPGTCIVTFPRLDAGEFIA